MDEQTQNTNVATPNEGEEFILPDEMTMLKQRADQMGVKYSPNIGLETLRERVNASVNGEPTSEEPDFSNMSEIKRKQAIRSKQQKEQLKLIRVQIANLNPHKRDLQGEIFTVGNKYVGTIKKFIPYGEESEEGWHIPYMLYNHLKGRKFLSIKTRKDRKSGNIVVDQKWVPEFNLVVMDPLTQTELKQLANRQAAAAGMAEDL